jgi:hypothetical protein
MCDTLTKIHLLKHSGNKGCIVLALCVFTITIFVAPRITNAQTTVFTYQGRLTDAGAPANGPYDLEFKLYNAGGIQLGTTLTREDVSVTDGVFSVELDFGFTPFSSGDASTLEIAVRPGASTGAFTTLTPRQPITSSPYAIKTISAAQLNGVAADQFVQTNDIRLSDQRPPTEGSGNYIQSNPAVQQVGASFNISGDGVVAGSLSVCWLERGLVQLAG